MKTVVCVFAHPDDEALGPSGTIATLSKTHLVYILCLTKGEAQGETEKQKRTLAKERAQELKQSARVLGVTKVFFLGFRDGTLSNNLYHMLAKKIEEKLIVLKPDILVTFDLLGISGHIDHVTTSLVTSFLFERKKIGNELWYYCVLKTFSDKMKNYFIFFPDGYQKKQINKIIDVKRVWETKVQAIKTHSSQAKDVKQFLKDMETLPKEEYFFVKKR